jgi:putative endonuclease
VHFVYIVRCADSTLYTGYARDPRARERTHNSGRGAKYTAGRRPVRLVYQEAFRSVGKALSREYAVKQLTRAQKDALVVRRDDVTTEPALPKVTVTRVGAHTFGWVLNLPLRSPHDLSVSAFSRVGTRFANGEARGVTSTSSVMLWIHRVRHGNRFERHDRYCCGAAFARVSN